MLPLKKNKYGCNRGLSARNSLIAQIMIAVNRNGIKLDKDLNSLSQQELITLLMEVV